MAVDGCAGPEHRNDDDPPDGQDDGRRFEFPDTRYAHEDAADPLCAAGLERNARDLRVAELTCPDSVADV